MSSYSLKVIVASGAAATTRNSILSEIISWEFNTFEEGTPECRLIVVQGQKTFSITTLGEKEALINKMKELFPDCVIHIE